MMKPEQAINCINHTFDQVTCTVHWFITSVQENQTQDFKRTVEPLKVNPQSAQILVFSSTLMNKSHMLKSGRWTLIVL